MYIRELDIDVLSEVEVNKCGVDGKARDYVKENFLIKNRGYRIICNF